MILPEGNCLTVILATLVVAAVVATYYVLIVYIIVIRVAAGISGVGSAGLTCASVFATATFSAGMPGTYFFTSSTQKEAVGNQSNSCCKGYILLVFVAQ